MKQLTIPLISLLGINFSYIAMLRIERSTRVFNYWNSLITLYNLYHFQNPTKGFIPAEVRWGQGRRFLFHITHNPKFLVTEQENLEVFKRLKLYREVEIKKSKIIPGSLKYMIEHLIFVVDNQGLV